MNVGGEEGGGRREEGGGRREESREVRERREEGEEVDIQCTAPMKPAATTAAIPPAYGCKILWYTLFATLPSNKNK